LSLGNPNLLKDPKTPQNPILSKPNMYQVDLQIALHHMLKEKKKGWSLA
jgi:hypothetical protein